MIPRNMVPVQCIFLFMYHGRCSFKGIEWIYTPHDVKCSMMPEIWLQYSVFFLFMYLGRCIFKCIKCIIFKCFECRYIPHDVKYTVTCENSLSVDGKLFFEPESIVRISPSVFYELIPLGRYI
jgi:hypothetical protein